MPHLSSSYDLRKKIVLFGKLYLIFFLYYFSWIKILFLFFSFNMFLYIFIIIIIIIICHFAPACASVHTDCASACCYIAGRHSARPKCLREASSGNNNNKKIHWVNILIWLIWDGRWMVYKHWILSYSLEVLICSTGAIPSTILLSPWLTLNST